MKRKGILTIALCAALAAAFLIGFPAIRKWAGNRVGSEAEAESTDRLVTSDGIVYGEVSAVGEETLTIKLGVLETAEALENSDEEGESMPETTVTGETAEKDAEEQEDKPADDVPDGEQADKAGLKLAGWEVTIRTKEETVVEGKRIEGTADAESMEENPEEEDDIRMEDLEEGDIVSVALDEEGYAEKITLMGSPPPDRMSDMAE